MKKNRKLLGVAIMMAAMCMTGFTAKAQKWGATPEDSANCVLNYSLYYEFYKQKDYVDAYTPWKEMLQYCPARHKNNYIHGANIIKGKLAAATTKAEQDTLIAELMNLYDMRIQYFGEAAKVTALKAYDLSQLRGEAALTEYYPIYAEAIRLGGQELDPVYVYKYFEATVMYVIKTAGDSSIVVDNYDIASDLLEKALIAHPEKAEEINKYLSNVEAAFSPFASCEQLVAIYSRKFAENPDDVNMLKKMTGIMMKKGCTNESLFFAATEKLHALEPSPTTALRMGQMCVSNDKFSKAAEYLNEAVKGLDDTRDQYKAYMLLGIAYGGSGSFSAARSAFYKAAEIDPTKGDPYLQVAQLYARSAHSISDGMNGRSAYWAAVDEAVRAKNVDASEANVNAANKMIGSFSANYPKQADAFMLNLMDGNSYTVPGWIGKTTTVRTRK